MPPATQERMQQWLAERRSGYSLPQPLYVDAEAFQFDVQAIFHSHWLQAALEIEIPNKGDFITLTIGNSPIVILRDANGGIRAFFNTCRHRGAKICQEERGHLTRFVCPYHQWTYDLQGQLLRATLMDKHFDNLSFGLRPVPVEAVAGVIFVCLSDDPSDFAPVRAALEPLLEPHELRKGKVAHTAVLVEHANWKLVMENARECHHCRARHPQLMRSFPDALFTTADAFSEPDARVRDFWARCESRGLKNGPISGYGFEVGRFPLTEGVKSVTLDGQPAVTQTLGRVGDGDIGSLRWALEPNCFNHALGDYVFLFQALPTGPQETIVTAKWVVNRNAVEGKDYDLARLVEVFTATNDQDKWLAENNQRGVNSASYMPGPYAPVAESRVIDFIDWYCAAAASFLNEQSSRPREP